MIEINSSKDVLENIKLRTIIIGPPGSGKTHFASTCPKSYILTFSRGEEDTFLVKPELCKNIVGYDVFVPNDDKGTKVLFGDVYKDVENGTIHKALEDAKKMYAEGKIETLVIDTVTFLVDYMWVYINSYCKKVSYNGELDTRGMYGDLNTKLIRLIGLNICSFPGNLVLTSHEMLESDDAMEKKPDKSSPVVASILGGFRNKVEGMFSNVLYLTKIRNSNDSYSYKARTNKGNGKNAKSRLPLPEVIDDISYGKIMECIRKGVEGGEVK